MTRADGNLQRYPKDELWMKVLVSVPIFKCQTHTNSRQVAVVWALDTTHQGLITHTVYTYLITEYGNPQFLGIIVETLLVRAPPGYSMDRMIKPGNRSK